MMNVIATPTRIATILTSMIGAPPLARHTPVECGNSTILLSLLGHAEEVIE
jgi:hypothetical protein